MPKTPVLLITPLRFRLVEAPVTSIKEGAVRLIVLAAARVGVPEEDFRVPPFRQAARSH
jgi:hypothetical protein